MACRARVTSRIAMETVEELVKEVKERDIKLLLQFDGKKLRHDMDGKAEVVERIMVSVSSPWLERTQLLAATVLDDPTGYNTAVSLYNTLLEHDLLDHVFGVLCDTPSVNWGAEEGAVYHFCRMVQRPLVLLQCIHHQEELVVKAVKKAIQVTHHHHHHHHHNHHHHYNHHHNHHHHHHHHQVKSSTSPCEHVAIVWQQEYNSVLDELESAEFVFATFDWAEAAKYPELHQHAIIARNWAREAWRLQEFGKGDYRTLVKYIRMWFGDMVPGAMIHRPPKVFLLLNSKYLNLSVN